MAQTENRFSEGDEIFDIDGNAYTVVGGRAQPVVGSKSYDLATVGRSFSYKHEFEDLPHRLRTDA